ncbi:MarR family winged helix-turn-helix transcriptional regulator [Aurantiacibacter rhizosphaerae]|uniref:MarR family transcriptional regulator n=1 Tax=Aurantiacibacter rhizosphaerae TaxID=2691582 RepID=A0A844X931_9SPHN|nr:MarR family transcriptional regulator [Aurantiacibacter rhizosphaerae]MWV26837.1 MarR family transcriptional regulator [Aurantiacibacter rhizosphaerae]
MADDKTPQISAVELSGWHLEDLDFPTFRMALLAKVMDRLTIRQLSEKFGISYAHWRVIARLGSTADGATVGLIAEQARADRAEVSRAVSALETQGLLARKEDASDRRMQVLKLTAKGKALYRKVLATRAEFHRNLTSDLSADEIAQFDALIEKVRAALEAAVEED